MFSFLKIKYLVFLKKLKTVLKNTLKELSII